MPIRKEFTGNVHIATPIAIAGLVVLLYFFYPRRVPAMADAGFGGSERHDYPFFEDKTDFRQLYPFSEEAPAQHVAINPYRSPKEMFPIQPVVNQDNQVTPWYQFLNDMFHSQSNAYLQRKAYP